jgi:hypothetical protein
MNKRPGAKAPAVEVVTRDLSGERNAITTDRRGLQPVSVFIELALVHLAQLHEAGA